AKPAKHAAEPTAEPAQKHSLNWHDIEILPSRGNRPVFSDTPRLARVLHAAGVAKLHLSLSHDGDSAQAFVVAERAGARSIAVAAGAEVGA
ncbi:MAG: hypothetical protein Q4C71_03560, partial [Microbacteriaceae bacterium]|nr:hypothetical protein [Microbacteriaceae bacterium]